MRKDSNEENENNESQNLKKNSEILYERITKLRKQVDSQYSKVLKGNADVEKIYKISAKIDELINEYNQALKEEGQ